MRLYLKALQVRLYDLTLHITDHGQKNGPAVDL